MPNPTQRSLADVLRWVGFGVCVAALAVCAATLVSCSSLQRTVVEPPGIPGATFIGNSACADCHKDYTRKFAGSAHSRVHIEGAAMKGESGCESCHGPGSLHAATPATKGSIVNPRKDAAGCFQCHLQTHAEFNLPQHHPLPEGKMNCVQCHDPHGFDIRKPARVGLGFSRLNEGCAQCHREQTRAFVYEHEVMREGCTVCHQPHGSVNAKMLIERDNNLCLKCHAQNPGTAVVGTGGLFIGKIDHRDFVRLGGCWSAGCHTAIHGSNVSPRMLY